MKTIGSVMAAGDSPKKTFYCRVSIPEQGSWASKKQQTKHAKIYFKRLNAPKCKAKPINARLLEKSVINAMCKYFCSHAENKVEIFTL